MTREGARAGSTPERRPYGRGRTTAQREAVARASDAIEGAFAVGRLAVAVRDLGSDVSTATIYRAVAALVEAGHLELVGDSGGHALYARCTEPDHHHHMVCTGCGSMTQAPCPLDAAALRRAADAGFVVTHHDATVYGLCRTCSAAGAWSEGS